MSPFDPTAALVSRLDAMGFDPRPTGRDAYESRCPAHDGDRRNLSIARGDDGRALVHCHAHGCDPAAIAGALGMDLSALFPPRDEPPARPRASGRARANGKPPAHPTPEAAIEATARKLGKPTARWAYHGPDGGPVMVVFRFDPEGERKQYRPVHRTPEGWRMGDPPGLLPLYRLPELADAARVVLCEGEKAADLAGRLGLSATASAHGAKSARKTDWRPLAGKEVVILPDHDPEGEAYVESAASILAGLSPRPTVKVVRLPDLWRTDQEIVGGADIEEWLRDGVPERWCSEDCLAELTRAMDSAPASALDAPPPAEPRGEPDPPEDDADGGEWGPIRLGAPPPVPPFPLDVLPDPARDLAEAAAESIACPVDFPAVACLAVASAAIGRSATLLIKPGYFAPASLYLALVGGPSSGKSPALRAALDPLWAIAHDLHGRWRAERDAWDDAPKDGRGRGPTQGRVVTTDPTTESLGPVLADNPRGMIVAPDEMTKWVMSMDQYKAGGRGGDRPFYLSAWNGEPIFIDRAKRAREPIVVPHPFLTVAGGMTPDMLSTLPEGRGRDDGFLARLLFAYPDRVPRRYSEAGIPVGVADNWRALILSLWERPMRLADDKPSPYIVRLSPDAARAWAAWCQTTYEEQEADDFPDDLEGAWGKLEAYGARLALILHLLHLSADPTRPPPDDPPELPRRIIEDAARLVDYFKAHCRRVVAAMGGKCDDGGSDVRALMRWIDRNKLVEFSIRDITRNLRRFRDDPAALADALDRMTRRNVIRPRPEPESAPRTGRKRTHVYETNPHLTAPRESDGSARE